jgi:hypothetical protein
MSDKENETDKQALGKLIGSFDIGFEVLLLKKD